jgi:putative transposase
MDLGGQAHRVKFMIRDRGTNFTAAPGAVLADAGIRTVFCTSGRPDERHRRMLDRGMPPRASARALIWNQAHLRRIPRQYETRRNQHRPQRSLNSAAPLKPLPEPVDLAQHRVRRHARVSGMINEYRLVA